MIDISCPKCDGLLFFEEDTGETGPYAAGHYDTYPTAGMLTYEDVADAVKRGAMTGDDLEVACRCEWTEAERQKWELTAAEIIRERSAELD